MNGDLADLYDQYLEPDWRTRVNDKEMWNNLGFLYTQLEQFDKASAAYQQALAIDPKFDLARNNLAIVQGKAKLAHAALKR